MAVYETTKLRRALKKIPGVRPAIALSVVLEDWWFDFRHHVNTSPSFDEQESRGWEHDELNSPYLPIRKKCALRVLQNLPIQSPREYTFIDFGSGKGRVLILAAEHGFGRACGIELRREFHHQAVRNFRHYRTTDTCSMESINMDARDYEFPDEKLVLFFFNPFGNEVMARVLAHLTASLDRCFRDVWVVLHDPTCPDLVDSTPQFRLEIAREGYRMYRSVRAEVPVAWG